MKVEFEVPVEREVAVSVNRGVRWCSRTRAPASPRRCRRWPTSSCPGARPRTARERRRRSSEGRDNPCRSSRASRSPVTDGTEVEAGQEPSKAAVLSAASVVSDPFADLKTRVHKDIIARLGPRLFNSESGKSDGDLEAAVNEAVTEVLALEKTPLTRQERQDIIRQISDDILGYGPLEPFLRDDSITEIMVNDPSHDLHRAPRQDHPHQRPVRRRAAPAADHRQDHQPHRPAHRRVVAVRGRPPAGRLACQRDHPAAGRARLGADHPKVPQRPVHDARPDQVRHAHPQVRAVPGGVRARQAEHPDLGRYRFR